MYKNKPGIAKGGIKHTTRTTVRKILHVKLLSALVICKTEILYMQLLSYFQMRYESSN